MADIIAVVLIGIFRFFGAIGKWLYQLLHDFFNEVLRGHKFRKALSKLLAGVTLVVVILLIVWLT
ncbi:MAG: hypothetical protein IJH12_10795 [Clostridia bacterium]|nr:hypothetical protein [Clostridia bacterium]